MAYQIIPNLTYLNRPVYTRNPALAVAAAVNAAGEDNDNNVPPVLAVPYNDDNNVPPVLAVPYNDDSDDDEPQDSWAGLHGIMGGKKRTRKYLSKNKSKSKKRRRVSIRRKSRKSRK
jgi:hypothetical protein